MWDKGNTKGKRKYYPPYSRLSFDVIFLNRFSVFSAKFFVLHEVFQRVYDNFVSCHVTPCTQNRLKLRAFSLPPPTQFLSFESRRSRLVPKVTLVWATFTRCKDLHTQGKILLRLRCCISNGRIRASVNQQTHQINYSPVFPLSSFVRNFFPAQNHVTLPVLTCKNLSERKKTPTGFHYSRSKSFQLIVRRRWNIRIFFFEI